MKIVTPTVIKISGSGRVAAPSEFWIQKDDGERFKVLIPTHSKIIEQFEWLSDNNCLIHMKSLEPTVHTNEQERALISERNHEMLDQWKVVVRSKAVLSPSNPFGMAGPILQDIPELEWTASWSFWCSDRALMFKLAMGGSQ